MTRLTPMELKLANLAGKIKPIQRGYETKEAAREWLVQATGQDFGFDAAKWRTWLRKNKRL